MKNREKNVALVAAGILIGSALAGPAANAAEMLAAQRSTQKIFVNGEEARLEAYAINDSNYVKLRDIGEAMGFEVSYDAASNNVYIGEQPKKPVQAGSRIVTLPADGSKYVPQVGDIIPCDDGTLYEVKNVDRWENNCFAPGPLPDLPEPTCDWSRFPAPVLPRVDVRHFSDASGDDLFVRNLYETLRMVYTLYNVLGEEPAAWRDGRLLSKISLTIPAEDEPYTGYFWPWRSVEIEKHARNLPNGRFKVEAFDYYHNGTFLETRYFICTA